MREDNPDRGPGPASGAAKPERSLLVVDDDAPFRQRLALAMERRGFEVTTADSMVAGIAEAKARRPAFAVIDLRLRDGSGIEVVSALREVRADARVIVLTGYGNIATAVAAVKMGAIDYLSKPADAELTVRVLHREVLEGLFGLDDARVRDGAVDFPKSTLQTARDVRGGRGALALYLNPLRPDDVFRVTEAGETLPQKSTFFYPKLPTGLLFRTLEPE